MANENTEVLNNYTYLPVNVDGIVATIKAWVLSVDNLYELLLGVSWQRSDERRTLAAEIMSYATDSKHGRRNRKQRLPEPGDLVMVRHSAIDNQHGRKLDPKWLGPRILVRWAKGKVSAYVREVHGDPTEKRYHVNDMMTYYARQADDIVDGTIMTIGPFGTTLVYTAGRGIRVGRNGSRAVLLSTTARINSQ